jgi:hypothetical protein
MATHGELNEVGLEDRGEEAMSKRAKALHLMTCL